MKLLLLLLTASLAWATCPNTGNGYSYCRSVTIDNTKVSGSSNHIDFPILFSGTYSYLADTGNGGKVESSSGWDIRFETPGSVQLDHELETYVNTTGEVDIWVEIPTLDHDDDTVIWMYYGKSGLGSSEEDINGTWNSNYVGVWHLNEGYSTVADFYEDSTSNDNHGTLTDADTDSASVSGQIGTAIHFNGDNDCITLPSNMIPSGNVTMEVWQETDSYASYQAPISWYTDNSDSQEMFVDTGCGWDCFYGGSFTYKSRTSDGALSANVWAHVVLVGQVAGNNQFYVDGSADGTSTTFSWGSRNVAMRMGSRGSSCSAYNWAGTMDEVRISNTNLSADWTATGYATQDSPATFYTIGSEDTPGVGAARRYAPIIMD